MENLGFGLNLTLFGMGLVFLLLGLLWLVLFIVGNLDRILPAAEEEQEESSQGVSAGPVVVRGHGAKTLSADALAAIAIAVVAHAAARRRQAAPAMRSTQPGSQIYASRWLAAGRTRQTRGWTPRR